MRVRPRKNCVQRKHDKKLETLNKQFFSHLLQHVIILRNNFSTWPVVTKINIIFLKKTTLRPRF